MADDDARQMTEQDAVPFSIEVYPDCAVILARRRLDILPTRVVVPNEMLDVLYHARLGQLVDARKQRSGQVTGQPA